MVHALDPVADAWCTLAQQATRHGVEVEVRVERAQQRTVCERHARAEQRSVFGEMRGERVEQIGEVRFDRRVRFGPHAEHRDRAAHAVRELARARRVAGGGGEVGARLALALGEAPAVVHRRQHQELVGVELEQVRDDALHRRRRVQRRFGMRRSSASRISLVSCQVSSSGVTTIGMKPSPVRGRITSR